MPDAISTVPQKIAIGIALLVAGSWLFYFVFAPTIGFDLLASWHNEQRTLQVLLLVCTTVSYLSLALVFSVVRVAAAFWIAFGLGAISACLSDLPFHAAAEVALAAQLVTLGALVATLVRLAPQYAARTFFYSAWLIGAVYIAGVAANYVGVVVEQRPVDLEVFILGYANPRFVSALHALILPLIAWLAMDPSYRPAVRYSSWLIAALLWTINLAMGTRAIWAAFFVTGIVFWWMGGPAGRRAIRALSATAAIGALSYLLAWFFAPFVLPQTGSMHARLGDLANASTRFDLWQAACNDILAHPWLGIGPMQFAKMQVGDGAHPHNWPLQLAAEWGLPALLIVLLLMCLWLRRLRIATAARVEITGYGVLPAIALSVLAAIVYGLVDGNWVMPVSQSLGVILMGASVGLLPGPALPAGNRLNLRSAAMMLAILTSSVVLARYTFETLELQEQNESEYVAKHRVRYFLPRFWQQGFIDEQPKE